MTTQFMADTQQGPRKAVDGGTFSPQAAPLYFRLPRAGTRDPMFGLSRSTWNNFLLPCKANNYNPPIRSITTNQNGRRGCRLIVTASALEYFEKLESEQVMKDSEEVGCDPYESRDCLPPTSPHQKRGDQTSATSFLGGARSYTQTCTPGNGVLSSPGIETHAAEGHAAAMIGRPETISVRNDSRRGNPNRTTGSTTKKDNE